MPIFCVKSVKIYTCQKKFTRAPLVVLVTNIRYAWCMIIVTSAKQNTALCSTFLCVWPVRLSYDWSSSYVRIFKFGLSDGRVIHSVVASSAWVQVLDRQHWPWTRSQVTITSERWIYSSFHSFNLPFAANPYFLDSKSQFPDKLGTQLHIESLGLQNQAKNLLDMFLAFLFLLQLFTEGVIGKLYVGDRGSEGQKGK